MTGYRFDGIDKHFAGRRILRDVGLSLRPGECQLLCGINGAGKSTLFRILSAIEKPNHCLVTDRHGTRSWRRAKADLLRNVIYLHQAPYLFQGTVAYNLNYPLRGPRREREAQVSRMLDWSGLSHLAAQPVQHLSGGERQRVALARAWLRDPKVMLLDEPTTNMDLACRQRTVELLRSLKETGVTLMIATHDTQHFAAIADRGLMLADGRLQEADMHAHYPDKVTPISVAARVSA